MEQDDRRQRRADFLQAVRDCGTDCVIVTHPDDGTLGLRLWLMMEGIAIEQLRFVPNRYMERGKVIAFREQKYDPFPHPSSDGEFARAYGIFTTMRPMHVLWTAAS